MNYFYQEPRFWYRPVGLFLVFFTLFFAVSSNLLAQANDDVCNAQSITVDAPPIMGDNTGATAQAGEVTSACTDAEHTIWYSFVPPATCAVTISTDFPNTSLHDTEIALYSATDCNDFGTFTSLNCDQDGGFAAPNGYTSIMEESNLIAGQTYYVQVNGWNSNEGEFMIEITSNAGTCPCDAPVVNYSVVENCSSGQFTVDVNVTGLGFATAVDISDDAGSSPIMNVGTGNYSFGPFNAMTFVTITVDGSNYGGCSTNSNALNGCLNETCDLAIPLSGTPINGDNTLATSDATNCGGNSVDDGLWYSFMGNGNDISVTVTGTNGYSDVQGAVYSGSCAALVCEGAFGGEGQTAATANIPASSDGTEYFVIVDGYTGDHGTYTISATGLTPLSIELMALKAWPLDKSNIIEWTTSTEKNAAWMQIERSSDGRNHWQEVGKVAARGSSNIAHTYNIEDTRPFPVSYYRLISIDNSGEKQYSEIIEVKRSVKNFELVNVYPIPSQDVVYLQIVSPKTEQQQVYITDIFGKIIGSQSLFLLEGQNDYPLNINHLPKGFYVVTFYTSGQRWGWKIIKE